MRVFSGMKLRRQPLPRASLSLRKLHIILLNALVEETGSRLGATVNVGVEQLHGT